MDKHICFWQRSLTVKQLLHGAKGRQSETLTLSPLLGGSSLGGPLGARWRKGNSIKREVKATQ